MEKYYMTNGIALVGTVIVEEDIKYAKKELKQNTSEGGG
jgi:hypothetical protein